MDAKIIDLLNRAEMLVGNPGANISASTDLAADNWQKDFQKVKYLINDDPTSYPDIYYRLQTLSDLLIEFKEYSYGDQYAIADFPETEDSMEELAKESNLYTKIQKLIEQTWEHRK